MTSRISNMGPVEWAIALIIVFGLPFITNGMAYEVVRHYITFLPVLTWPQVFACFIGVRILTTVSLSKSTGSKEPYTFSKVIGPAVGLFLVSLITWLIVV